MDATVKPRRSRLRKSLRLLACVPIGIVLAVVLIIGSARLGLLDFLIGPKVSGELTQVRSSAPGVRVLLVGNSFTSYNNMPHMVQGLADHDPGGGPPLFVVSYTQDGATLKHLSGQRRLTDLIAEAPWDSVVLQEQSQVLSFAPSVVARQTVPYARRLKTEITAAGARTVLEMTWGYAHGDQLNSSSDTYSRMQARLEQGYERLGRELGATVAPVGIAWHAAISLRPDIDLWADDMHPNRAGSYLTACVLYAVLTGRDPTGNPYTGGLSPADARFFQLMAEDGVMTR